jgi:2-keto-4-pentenoate hydratase/2-oxohepta-3-ene-1,7-dioic acid hydratase in catechol pathway
LRFTSGTDEGRPWFSGNLGCGDKRRTAFAFLVVFWLVNVRIANAKYRGAPKIVLSEANGEWLDFTLASQLRASIQTEQMGQAPASLQQLLESARFSLEDFLKTTEFARHHRLSSLLLKESDLVFQAPFSRPGQVIALARNYSAHAQESTLPVPHEPIFFSKSNTSVIGPGDSVVLPPNLGRIEPEIELAFVISKRASHVPASRAADYIGGYTVLNDVSAQELQSREIQEGYPLFRCKSLETFTPIGPWLVTVDEIGTSPALQMTLRVNGETRVTTNTSGLTFGIAMLVEFISGYLALYPGDIITTGCPKAAGAICPGDVMELEIEKIGILRNPVVAGTEPCPA